MIDSLALAVVVASLLLGVVALVLAGLDRPPPRPLLVALAALEALVVVQVVVAAVRLVTGDRPDSVASFVGYLLVVLIVLPLGVLWSLEERTRWSTVVLAVACLTVAAMTGRLLAIWSTVGA